MAWLRFDYRTKANFRQSQIAQAFAADEHHRDWQDQPGWRDFFDTYWRLIWTAVSNTTYRLEFNPDLGPSNWIALPGDVIGVSNTASKLDVVTSSSRLYRVRVLP